MEKGYLVLVIVAAVIFVVAIISILIINYRNKINSLKYNMNVSNNTIKDNLKNKLDLTIRTINIIERELKLESKKFEAVKKIRNEKINSINFDNILSDATEEIMDIKDDYKEIVKVKSFKGLINDIKELDILLSGGKKFYNKYAAKYNALIKKFPYKLFKKKYPYKQLYFENIMEDNLEMKF